METREKWKEVLLKNKKRIEKIDDASILFMFGKSKKFFMGAQFFLRTGRIYTAKRRPSKESRLEGRANP